jgi:broad specificity phosphatase PhoE
MCLTSDGGRQVTDLSRSATVLLFARHGETEWNRTHRWQGFTGPPLNALGRKQSEQLAASLNYVDAIYSSDTVRVRETASIIASRRGLPVVEDARLREVNFGEWESLTRQEINKRYADAFDRWDACDMTEPPPGGETDPTMANRVLEAVREIAAKHRGQRVLVVTSGGRSVLCRRMLLASNKPQQGVILSVLIIARLLRSSRAMASSPPWIHNRSRPPLACASVRE